MKALLVLLTFFISNALFALEIDEKLTLRFLKVSNSKKTILINRGAEDGLAVGDHAKFFVTAGVIARGVVEKVSPSRSVWSLYRVVDPNEITDGKVLNLKIASPVKITEDPSRSLKDEPIPGGSEQMGLSEGSEAEVASGINESEQKELEGMGIEEKPLPAKKVVSTKAEKSSIDDFPVSQGSSNTSRTWEVWGMLALNSLSGTVSSDAATVSSSTATTASTVDFSGGLEYYFFKHEGFFKNFSITALFHKRTIELGQNFKLTSDWLEFGGGASYHFYNPPSAVNKFIAFGTLNLGTGSSTVKQTLVTNGKSEEIPVKGTNTFFSAGIGAKYNFSNGFGVRALLDYYRSSESQTFENDVTVKSTLAGPRTQMGVSYRF